MFLGKHTHMRTSTHTDITDKSNFKKLDTPWFKKLTSEVERRLATKGTDIRKQPRLIINA